jgi:hypothetical protein
MSGTRKCLNEVKAAQGEDATDDDALARLEAIDQRATRLQRTKGMSREEAVAEAGKQLTAEEEAAAAVEKANRLMNLKTRISRREQIEDTANAVAEQRKKGIGGSIQHALGRDRDGISGDLGKAIQNQIIAISTPVKGGRFSAEAQWKTRAKEYTGMIVELKKAGLLNTVRSGQLENEWGRELFELSMEQAGEQANPGSTGNKQAEQIAKIIHRYQTLAKERLNRVGAWIGDYPGWIARTGHDPDAIRQAGLDGWKKTILPLLDQERTFETVDDQGKYLDGVYHALITGVHLADDGPIGFKDPTFTGPGNLAARVSAERQLHFKDGASWLAYQKQFGTGTLFEQVLSGLDRSARQEALMARWGTNPRAEFEQDQRYFQEKFRDTDPDGVVRLREAQIKLDGLFSVLDGRGNMPGNKMAAQISADLRTVKSMASLGNVAFAHFSAAVTKAAELRYQGVGFLERYSDFLESMFRGRGRSEESQELTDLLLAGTEGMHGRILNRFTPDDTMAGTLSKIANRYFSATGLTYLLDAQKSGAMRVMSRFLGRRLDQGYEALPPETKRAFLQYGIEPEDWDALRNAPNHPEIDGRKFLTPDAAYRSTAELDDGERDALALKLHGYFSDVADRSIVTPGLGDRAVLTLGTHPGTISGEALRFVSQFKTWGIAAARQGLGRELYGGQGTTGAASGIMQMAAGAAAIGYLTMTLKGLFAGQNPRPPNDVKTWMAAMIQGGGFGILGDYLFGEYNRFGGGVGESILGPVLGQGSTDILNIWNDLKNAPDDPKGHVLKDLGGDTLKIAQGWTPFVNLFYTRALVNYLFVNELQEMMNPGYLQRHEQIVKRLNNTTYWLSPSRFQQTPLSEKPGFALQSAGQAVGVNQ